MTTMVAARTPQDAAPAPFRRRIEIGIAGVGLAAALILQGGFALVVARADADTLTATVVPALRDAGLQVSDADADVALNTLAAWFGYSLIVTALLCAIGTFIALRAPRRRSTGWLFAGAGLVCLFGTQFVLYPVAFLFFLAGALFAVRTPTPRSTP